MLVFKLWQFFVLLGLASAANFQAQKEVFFSSSTVSGTPEWLVRERQLVLDFLLQKFNALIAPKRVSAIPWDSVICDGWPENVSYYTKDWSIDDTEILQDRLPEIDFKLAWALRRDPFLRDSQMMLDGKYSNTTFDRFSEQYRGLSFMGHGGYGFVLKCQRILDGTLVAVKFIYQPRLDPIHWTKHPRFGRVPFEVDVLSRVSHPGIIQLLDYFDDGTYSYMVTELFGTTWSLSNRALTLATHPTVKFGSRSKVHYASEGFQDLGACLNLHTELPEDKIHYIFTQVYRAVLDLHRKGLCHGDLKIENILIDDTYRIKLIDFGLARETTEEADSRNFFGTEETTPPEIFLNRPYQCAEMETWTLGVLLYTLKFIAFPFRDRREIVDKKLNLPLHDPTGIYDLIDKMLTKDPTQRIKLTDIAKHPWMNPPLESSLGKKRKESDQTKEPAVIRPRRN